MSCTTWLNRYEAAVYIDSFITNIVVQIPTIMSLLVFQNSRRQLLSALMSTIDDANNLLKAVEAADAECKKLEYWSDIRKLAENGNAGHATDSNCGWDDKWQGLDNSGAPHP